MPLAKLRAVKKAGLAAVERQAPEPRNRMVRREMVHDRHATKQELRELARAGQRPEEWPASSFPQHVCE